MFKGILIILFLLIAVGARAQSDCASIMHSLMQRSQAARVDSALVHLQSYAQEIELTPELIDEMARQWEQGLSEVPSEQAENWLFYVKTLAPEKQLEAMQLMASIRATDSSEKVIKRFQKIEKKIEKKYTSYHERAVKRLQKKNPSMAMEEVRQQAKNSTEAYMKSYRRLSFECRSKTMNATRKQASKTFKKFTIGIGIVSSFGSMAYANRDNDFKDWIGQFGYETVMGIITGNIASKIVSNPRDSDLGKAIKKYFFSRGTGLVDMGLYGMLFGANRDEAQARLDEVMSDPDRAERLREMQKVFEEKHLYQKVRQTFVDGLRSVKGKIGLENAPPIEIGVDWGNLSEEDLKREDVQDVLLAAAIAEIYAEGEGSMIVTGNIGADRYAFHAAYGLIMLPKDMMTTMWIYNILCLGMAQPRTAIMKATAVYAINRLISDQIYYAVRRSAINQ